MQSKQVQDWTHGEEQPNKYQVDLKNCRKLLILVE